MRSKIKRVYLGNKGKKREINTYAWKRIHIPHLVLVLPRYSLALALKMSPLCQRLSCLCAGLKLPTMFFFSMYSIRTPSCPHLSACISFPVSPTSTKTQPSVQWPTKMIDWSCTDWLLHRLPLRKEESHTSYPGRIGDASRLKFPTISTPIWRFYQARKLTPQSVHPQASCSATWNYKPRWQVSSSAILPDIYWDPNKTLPPGGRGKSRKREQWYKWELFQKCPFTSKLTMIPSPGRGNGYAQLYFLLNRSEGLKIIFSMINRN